MSQVRTLATLGAIAALLSGCGGGNAAAGGTGGTTTTSRSTTSGTSTSGTTTSGSTTSGTTTTPGSCSPDPLHTGLVAMQTGVSVDAFDCPILEWTAKYGE